MNYFECVLKIYPDWKGMCVGNTYDGIKPHSSETRPIPTLKELKKVWKVVESELKIKEMDMKRQSEYPTTDELIIALWEKVVENNIDVIDKIQAKRLSIKEKYPKN